MDSAFLEGPKFKTRQLALGVLHNLGLVDGVGSLAMTGNKKEIIKLFTSNFKSASEYLTTNKNEASEIIIEDVWTLVATFNMIIADNKDIVHMMLINGLDAIMTNLFSSIISVEIKQSGDFTVTAHCKQAIFMLNHFFILCTQN